jgi:hypothetical protein
MRKFKSSTILEAVPILSDMVRRILRSIHLVGIDQWESEIEYTVDVVKHNAAALEGARQ